MTGEPRGPDEGTGATGDGAPADRPAGEVVEHLQEAAREMIAAGRSLLDALERVVDDPGTTLGLLVGRVPRPDRNPGGGEPPRVERIEVRDGEDPPPG